jgi:class 3 adenylate cyclase
VPASADEVGQLTWAVNAMLGGLEERDFIKDAFSRYVTRQVSDVVLQGGLELGGELLTATILMADIRDFTGLSERMPPRQVVRVLNRYFTEMVEECMEHGGMIDKFIGDAIMVVFGAPARLTPEQSARAAAHGRPRHAPPPRRPQHRVRRRRPAPLRIGIGIHTGEAIAGNIGAPQRLDYTLIGDSSTPPPASSPRPRRSASTSSCPRPPAPSSATAPASASPASSTSRARPSRPRCSRSTRSSEPHARGLRSLRARSPARGRPSRDPVPWAVMADEGDLRYQWAVRRTTFTPDQAARLVTALGDATRDACAAHFPASEGYETRATQLHGMLEGVRVCVSKGEFSAVVSTQCYLEPVPPSGRVAVRQVAAVRHHSPPGPRARRASSRSPGPVLLLILGSAVAFALISALWVSGIGGYFRLSLWMSFMIMMAPAIAWLLGARANLQQGALEATRVAFLTRPAPRPSTSRAGAGSSHVMHDQQALVPSRAPCRSAADPLRPVRRPTISAGPRSDEVLRRRRQIDARSGWPATAARTPRRPSPCRRPPAQRRLPELTGLDQQARHPVVERQRFDRGAEVLAGPVLQRCDVHTKISCPSFSPTSRSQTRAVPRTGLRGPGDRGHARATSELTATRRRRPASSPPARSSAGAPAAAASPCRRRRRRARARGMSDGGLDGCAGITRAVAVDTGAR